MKKAFPLHGIIGIILLIFSEILLFKKIEPFYSCFYCFAWWSYILIIDAIIYRFKGNSLILSRTKEFFLMIPWSIFIWLIFEAANLSLENWYYINLPRSTVHRWLGYAIAYGTVIPGIFETTEFLETIVVFKVSRIKKIIFPEKNHRALVLLGVLCTVFSMVIPKYCFPLIWIGFIFLLEPFNYRSGARSLLKDLEGGNPKKIYFLLIAGLICGLLWEFWNFWSLSKWIYTVPFLERMKGFEMPVLGFLGFPPFAVQAYVMYNFISLFRFERPLTIILTAILIVSFSILIFRAIDLKTMDSYFTRLQDAYWIDPKYRRELPRVGIANLDDLILKTKDNKERDELALRLLIPKEKLIHWIKKTQLVQLRGLGVENLRMLEELGIHSVQALADEYPERLHKKLEQVFHRKLIPRQAKIRIWVKEAKKER